MARARLKLESDLAPAPTEIEPGTGHGFQPHEPGLREAANGLCSTAGRRRKSRARSSTLRRRWPWVRARDTKALLSAVVTAWIESTLEVGERKPSTKVTYATLLRPLVARVVS
jgi:hypothetical protein